MPFWSREKPSSSVKGVAKKAAPLYQSTEADAAWRQKYDRDRAKAFTEGRGCGSCIDGVVWFGERAEDQTACNCEFSKKKAENAG